jgi:uncharacterized protein
VSVYFDTSAFVKLFITEAGSDLARALWNSDDLLATNRATYIEARAAVAAARRAGRVQEPERASQALEDRFRELEVVELTSEIARTAGDLAEKHLLRGYDALHLASSLALPGDPVVMVTWDRELAVAAYRSGLDLAGISLE